MKGEDEEEEKGRRIWAYDVPQDPPHLPLHLRFSFSFSFFFSPFPHPLLLLLLFFCFSISRFQRWLNRTGRNSDSNWQDSPPPPLLPHPLGTPSDLASLFLIHPWLPGWSTSLTPLDPKKNPNPNPKPKQAVAAVLIRSKPPELDLATYVTWWSERARREWDTSQGEDFTRGCLAALTEVLPQDSPLHSTVLHSPAFITLCEDGERLKSQRSHPGQTPSSSAVIQGTGPASDSASADWQARSLEMERQLCDLRKRTFFTMLGISPCCCCCCCSCLRLLWICCLPISVRCRGREDEILRGEEEEEKDP